MKKPLILIGGGGHCSACIDVIEAEGKYAIEGILDTKEKIGTCLFQYPIIGDDTSIEAFATKGISFLITVGQIKSAQLRQKLFQNLISKHASLATVIAPSAIISRYAKIGAGTIVMHGVTVNAGAVVGNNVILNTGCLVEHDVLVSDHVHISTHAVLNGGVCVEEASFVGSNAVVAQQLTIKSHTVVGAGSVVVANIKTAGVYIGNPARLRDEN